MISIQAVTSFTFVTLLSLFSGLSSFPPLVFFFFLFPPIPSLKFAVRLEEFHPPPVIAFGKPSDGGGGGGDRRHGERAQSANSEKLLSGLFLPLSKKKKKRSQG